METTFIIVLSVMLIACGLREISHLFENRRNNINTLKEQIANIRENIESTLLAVMRHHDVETIQCDGFSNTPIISNDVDTFTLNEIQLCRTVNGDEYILFEGSSDYDNIYITAKSMDIEYLIGVYEWAMENQEVLLEVEDDE